MRVYTVPEVADLFHVTQYTVRKWCRTGVLEAHKVGKSWIISANNWQIKKLREDNGSIRST